MSYQGGAQPNPPVGTAQETTSSETAKRVNIQATLEPDADGDGYGDETQDLCPSQAATRGAYPPGTSFSNPQPIAVELSPSADLIPRRCR